MDEENADNIEREAINESTKEPINSEFKEPEWMKIIKKLTEDKKQNNVKESLTKKEVLSKDNMNKDKIKQEKGIKFWRDWLNADLLKREEMIGNLPIMKSIWGLGTMPKRIRKRALTIMLNSFFEDLEAQIYLGEW